MNDLFSMWTAGAVEEKLVEGSVQLYVTQGRGGKSRGTGNSTQHIGRTYSVSPVKVNGYP